ncbi:MAG: U32 family peptidase [Clostridiales bacterium]|nr:U32 family peptidase [Clostridiales bacterium]
MIEILAPCGSMESIVAAVNSGADAVYLGLKAFSARGTAENFDEKSLKQACDFCHRHGVFVYLTLNTLIFDYEIEALFHQLKIAALCKVDAIIIQDMAVAQIVKIYIPNMPLHGSTQMSVNSLEGVLHLQKLGFSRVVIGRELSFSQIKYIAQNSKIELEVFVHGALCTCVSGQCYMSSAFGERSANRGYCAQPCRLNFSNGKLDYALSLKDNSIIKHLPELEKIGIKSAKIEGRLKRAEYVFSAVKACKASLQNIDYNIEQLEGVFSRNGFTSGYYEDKFDKMQGTRTKNVKQVKEALSQVSDYKTTDFKRFFIDIEVVILENESSRIKAELKVFNKTLTVCEYGDIPQKAKNTPLNKDYVLKQVLKLGGTSFTLENASIKLDDNLFLPASAINALRRRLLKSLENALLKIYSPSYEIKPWQEKESLIDKQLNKNYTSEMKYRCQVRTKNQVKSALFCGYEKIYAPIETLLGGEFDSYKDDIIINPPVFLADCENEVVEKLQFLKGKGFSSVLCHNFSHIAIADKLGYKKHGSFRLNITNSISAMFYKKLGMEDLILSIEMKLRDIEKINTFPKGIISYGKLPLMITRRSPIQDGKPKPFTKSELWDKNNRPFDVYESNVSEILNPDILWLADKNDELKFLDFTVHFLGEDDNPQQLLDKHKQKAQCNHSFTRGAYFRGIK